MKKRVIIRESIDYRFNLSWDELVIQDYTFLDPSYYSTYITKIFSYWGDDPVEGVLGSRIERYRYINEGTGYRI